MTKFMQTALDWVDDNQVTLSDWHQIIWHYAEPAWREYRSAKWYVQQLRANGFEVEEASGGMPTAFSAVWRNGRGPTIGGYAEYDAVPGNCQAASTKREPREGLNAEAPGHTDPHSGLGMGSFGGLLATKAAMERHNIGGTLRFFGEPAEKVRGSKPVHAARGYYDELDAMISFHPHYMMPLCNTVSWDTHCGVGYAMIYRFICDHPETWQQEFSSNPIPQSHASSRAPGAQDALLMMMHGSRFLRESMLPHSGSWSLSEAILTAGQATADNLPATRSDIQYMLRVPDIVRAEQVCDVLDRNAEAVAKATHCRWERHWVSKSRPGLANHAMAEVAYEALESVGPPQWGEQAFQVARELQRAVNVEPMDQPFAEACTQLIEPREAEKQLRELLPPVQTHFTSDDYTDMCWQTPTVRLYIARPMLKAPDNFAYPGWVMNALGGIRETIDPMVECAAKTVSAIMLRLLTDKDALAGARSEFEQRTGGGIGGSTWMPPLCDYEPPVNFRWPEYVTTARGEQWCIPD